MPRSCIREQLSPRMISRSQMPTVRIHENVVQWSSTASAMDYIVSVLDANVNGFTMDGLSYCCKGV